MPKYMIIAYLKSDIKSSIFTVFAADKDEERRHVYSLMDFGFRVAVYEWYETEDDNEMPYYKILCECFRMGDKNARILQ